jgi:hypothetical protein
MAERDPFGRLPDENPLAGLGSFGDGASTKASDQVAAPTWSGRERAAEPQPVARAADPVAGARPAAPPPRPPGSQASAPSAAMQQSLAEAIRQAEAMSGVKVVQSARTAGRIIKLVVFLIVIGVIASVGSSLVGAGKDIRDAVSDLPSASKINDEVSKPSQAVKPEKAQSPPTGVSSNSMIARRNFAPAINRLRKSGLGSLRTLSIRPERLDAQLLTKGGSLRSVQVRYDEPAIDDFGAGSSGFSHLETVLYSKIDTAAPGRLARSAAGRARRPVSQVDYVVLSSVLGKTTWIVFMKGGRAYMANAHGSITRRIS